MRKQKVDKRIQAFNLDSDTLDKLEEITPKNKLSEKINQLITDEVEKNSSLFEEPENIRILKKEIGNLNGKKTDMERQQADIDLNLPLITSKVNFLVSEIKRLKKVDKDAK